jgi:hypothetical protein
MDDAGQNEAGDRGQQQAAAAGSKTRAPALPAGRRADSGLIVPDRAHRQSIRSMRGRLSGRVSPAWLEIGVS